MMNGDFTFERARKLAERWNDVSDDEAFVADLFRTLAGRPPEPKELERSLAFLQGSGEEEKQTRRVDFCHVLLNSNLFLYVE